MWLILFILLHMNTLVYGEKGKVALADDVEYGRVPSADDVKAIVCPNCIPIQDGDIEEFWVEHYVSGMALSRANVNTKFSLGSFSYENFNISYPLYEVPVYLGNDKYHNFLLEVNRQNQLKIHQLHLPNGEFEVEGKSRNFRHCFNNATRWLNRDTAFVHEQFYIVNETFGYDITKLCKDKVDAPYAYFAGFKWDTICFQENAKCVTDFKTGEIVSVEKKNAVYMWGRVVVWIGCAEERCIYLIHDTVKGTDWYIPDTIRLSNDHTGPRGYIHALIPLITSTSPLLKRLKDETTSAIEDDTTSTTEPATVEEALYTTIAFPVEPQKELDSTHIYIISASMAVFFALIVIIVLLYMTCRKRQTNNKTTKSLGKRSTRTSKAPKKTKKTTVPLSRDQASSGVQSSAVTTTQATTKLDDVTVKCLVCTAEQDKLFEANELDGLEAELPLKQLEGPAMPLEGTYVVFKHIGVTLPPKVFAHTFGEFDLNLGQDRRTLVYEYEGCGLKRIEAISAIMTHAKDNQKNGTIHEMICTVRLDKLNIQLLVIPKLGPSVESTVLNGGLSLEETINLVSQTLSCMEDLLECNIIHRDIKPSSFRYDSDGPKIFVTNFGLARIPTAHSRSSVPFFGNLVFASLSTHLQLERTHYDDMISWFYVVIFIINKEMLVWKVEKDRTRIFQLKNNLLEEKVIKKHVKNLIKGQKAQNLIRCLHELVVQLPVKKKPTYSKIRHFVNSLTK